MESANLPPLGIFPYRRGRQSPCSFGTSSRVDLAGDSGGNQGRAVFGEMRIC